jgi:CRP-like cAMP-binding protein
MRRRIAVAPGGNRGFRAKLRATVACGRQRRPHERHEYLVTPIEPPAMRASRAVGCADHTPPPRRFGSIGRPRYVGGRPVRGRLFPRRAAGRYTGADATDGPWGKRMTVNAGDLAKLYPLDSLRPENLEQLSREATTEELGRGAVLFNAGENDDHTIFVLSGRVRGDYPDGKVKEIDAATLQGRYALGDTQPRRFTATVASISATVLKIDRRYMEKILCWDQLSRSENFHHYDPSPESNRWVFRLLQSRVMHKLPTAGIERMFQRFEEVEVRAGDVIVGEGEEADYFYVIKDGAASVSKSLETGDSVVAYLVRGDTFGEDALLANTARNATVTMIKDGKLMRLAKRAFDEVMKPPAVDWLTPGKASIFARNGAVVLDVRMPEEFQQRAIKGAINTPLYTLRETVNEYDRGKKYVVYCNTGERSAAAAFIMSKMGFDVYALHGGISGMIKQIDRTQA